MLFKNIGYHIVLPFRNLSTQARILQIIRLVTCCTTLALIIASLIGSLINREIYIARINCAHLDVARGLYETLRNSVSVSSSVVDSGNDVLPVDSSLTNSEISILTYYAESQVANAPQYIVTSLWSWCYGNYNTTEHVDKHGVTHILIHDDVLTCSRSTKNYIFDYRKELELVGLDGILAYAYQSTDLNDKHYEKTVDERDKRYKLVPSGLIFSASSQLVILVFGSILYSNRGPERDLTKISVFFMNIMALISVASFISMAVSAGLISNLLIQIRGEISNNLGNYGIALHFGRIWFLLIWGSFSFAFFGMLSWTFPLWCANPPEFDEEDEEYDTSYRTENMVDEEDIGSLRRNQSGSSKYKSLSRSDRYKSSGVKYSMSDHAMKEFDVEERDFSGPENFDFDDDDDLYNDANNKGFDGYGTRSEDELRKLGETLSRKMSVRRLNRRLSKRNHAKLQSKSHPLDEASLFLENDPRTLLYHDTNMKNSKYPMPESISQHYREETFDGYGNDYRSANIASTMSLGTSKSLTSNSRPRNRNNEAPIHDMLQDTSKTAKITGQQHDLNFRSNSLQERHFQHNTRNNPFLRSDELSVEHNKRNSNGDSFLNFDEMEILDNNNYINRIP